MHSYFSLYRKSGSELFDISLAKFISDFPLVGLIFEDDSEVIRNQAAPLIDGLKSAISANIDVCPSCPSPEILAHLIEGIRVIMVREGCSYQSIGQMTKLVFSTFSIQSDFIDSQED